MKTESISRLFFNPRILIGFILYAAGLVLALPEVLAQSARNSRGFEWDQTKSIYRAFLGRPSPSGGWTELPLTAPRRWRNPWCRRRPGVAVGLDVAVALGVGLAVGVPRTLSSPNGAALIVLPYGPKFTVTVLEQVWLPATHTLYMKLAWPVVPVESSYKPSFGVVAITTPSR